jgi:hypothetical protein
MKCKSKLWLFPTVNTKWQAGNDIKLNLTLFEGSGLILVIELVQDQIILFQM